MYSIKKIRSGNKLNQVVDCGIFCNNTNLSYDDYLEEIHCIQMLWKIIFLSWNADIGK